MDIDKDTQKYKLRKSWPKVGKVIGEAKIVEKKKPVKEEKKIVKKKANK